MHTISTKRWGVLSFTAARRGGPIRVYGLPFYRAAAICAGGRTGPARDPQRIRLSDDGLAAQAAQWWAAQRRLLNYSGRAPRAPERFAYPPPPTPRAALPERLSFGEHLVSTLGAGRRIASKAYRADLQARYGAGLDLRVHCAPVGNCRRHWNAVLWFSANSTAADHAGVRAAIKASVFHRAARIKLHRCVQPWDGARHDARASFQSVLP